MKAVFCPAKGIFMIPLAPKATGEGDHRSPIREHLMQKRM